MGCDCFGSIFRRKPSAFSGDDRMNKGIYQHFSIEDRPFLDKGMEWIKKVEDSYAPFLTPFINPHQEKLLKILAKTYGLACSSSG
ncbi:RNA-binding protein, partial [Streptococcus pneumoniae]